MHHSWTGRTNLQFLGDRCYPSLEASPVKLDVVNVVGSTEGWRLWMQPGSGSEATINFYRKNSRHYLWSLIMIERRNR